MKITIKRYDPTKDVAPYEVDYEVPCEDEYMTMLEALMYIYENEDAVAFDFACRGRDCGRCAMNINGEPALACTYHVTEGSNYTLEPLGGMPVIRDLIVDKSVIQSKIAQSYNRVRIEPISEEEAQTFDSMEHLDDLNSMEWCCRCQVCTSGCPVRQIDPTYIGPSHMLAIAFRHFDPYDQADRLVEAVQGGLFKCTLCGTCDENCSSLEINHVEIWKKLRDEAEARGLKPSNA